VNAYSRSTARRHALQDDKQFHNPLVFTPGKTHIKQDEMEARKTDFQVSLGNQAIHI